MSDEEYESLLAQQDHLCALCGRPFGLTPSTRAVIDHDHKTGKFRGVLHSSCNIGLGHYYDRPELLEAAAAYLRKLQPEE
jgi:hypothetical protein